MKDKFQLISISISLVDCMPQPQPQPKPVQSSRLGLNLNLSLNQCCLRPSLLDWAGWGWGWGSGTVYQANRDQLDLDFHNEHITTKKYIALYKGKFNRSFWSCFNYLSPSCRITGLAESHPSNRPTSWLKVPHKRKKRFLQGLKLKSPGGGVQRRGTGTRAHNLCFCVDPTDCKSSLYPFNGLTVQELSIVEVYCIQYP